MMTVGDKCSRCNKCLKKKSADENETPSTIDKLVKKRPKWKQHMVFDVEDEDKNDWEPYMLPLKKYFSDASIACDSNAELIDWKKINIPNQIRIRTEYLIPIDQDQLEAEDEVPNEVEKKESNSNVILPWGKLLVTKTVSIQEKRKGLDTSLKIPWEDLVVESSMEMMNKPYDESEDEPCPAEHIEMPWEEFMIPQNIKIKKQISNALCTLKPAIRKSKKSCCLKLKHNEKRKIQNQL